MNEERKLKYAKRAYQPYHKEALHCLQIYILIVLCAVCIFAALSAYANENLLPVFGIFLIICTVLEVVLNHRLSLLAVWELKKQAWDVDELEIQEISEEASWSGYMFVSVIADLYPKNLRVQRYKLKCKTKDGKTICLRAVMGGKKYQIIQDRIFQALPTKCTVHYGRKTHVILWFVNDSPWTDLLNHLF